VSQRTQQPLVRTTWCGLKTPQERLLPPLVMLYQNADLTSRAWDVFGPLRLKSVVHFAYALTTLRATPSGTTRSPSTGLLGAFRKVGRLQASHLAVVNGVGNGGQSSGTITTAGRGCAMLDWLWEMATKWLLVFIIVIAERG